MFLRILYWNNFFKGRFRNHDLNIFIRKKLKWGIFYEFYKYSLKKN